MKTKDWFKNKLEELKDDFEFRLEGFILHITEDVCKRMVEKDMKRSDLAKRLNVSPPAVTKILNGSSNFTLRTLLSIADALEYELDVKFVENNPDSYVCSVSEAMTMAVAADPPYELLKIFGIGRTAWPLGSGPSVVPRQPSLNDEQSSSRAS
ncbi:MAG: helix-turn-helix transcriptional regulator [Desulfobacterales bacterium]|nr:helix-turn-helix transcriptional regulator [Desulfobacterales bacterium]